MTGEGNEEEEVTLCAECGLPVDGDGKAVKVCESGGCHHKNAVKCTKGDCACSVCFDCHELHPCEMHRPFFRDQFARDFATDKFEEMGHYWARHRKTEVVQVVLLGKLQGETRVFDGGDEESSGPEEWEPLAFLPQWEVDG